jgi:two-component system alkaline phosphatase synthesis response regulator PhoP
MAEARILVVDDEPSIVNLVFSYLRKEGYEVQTAADGPGALKALHAFQPDLVVLDIMLPGIDGLEVLAQLRRESDAYVILLTAKTEEVDRVVGLSVGADDYVTKPFSPRELTARVKAALRRLRGGRSPGQGTHKAGGQLVFKQVRLDSASRQAWANEQLLDLTAIEFDLLRVLAAHRGIVLSREQLLDLVWGTTYYGETRLVDVHIGNLRRKMGDAGDQITTVRGAGYRFDDERA